MVIIIMIIIMIMIMIIIMMTIIIIRSSSSTTTLRGLAEARSYLVWLEPAAFRHVRSGSCVQFVT